MSSPIDVAERPAVGSVSDLVQRVGDGARLSDDDIQLLMTTAVKLYADRVVQSERQLRAFVPNSGVTATQAMIATTAILKGSNLQLFELGMWQAWSRQPAAE